MATQVPIPTPMPAPEQREDGPSPSHERQLTGGLSNDPRTWHRPATASPLIDLIWKTPAADALDAPNLNLCPKHVRQSRSLHLKIVLWSKPNSCAMRSSSLQHLGRRPTPATEPTPRSTNKVRRRYGCGEGAKGMSLGAQLPLLRLFLCKRRVRSTRTKNTIQLKTR